MDFYVSRTKKAMNLSKDADFLDRLRYYFFGTYHPLPVPEILKFWILNRIVFIFFPRSFGYTAK